MSKSPMISQTILNDMGRQEARQTAIASTHQVVSFSSPLNTLVFKFMANGEVIRQGETPADNPISFTVGPEEDWAVFALSMTSAGMGQLVADLNAAGAHRLILGKSSLVANDLRQLANVGGLQSLGLALGWADIEGVEDLLQITELDLSNATQLPSTELARLSNLSNLKTLNLNSAALIDNSGMPHLAAMTGLEHVVLNRTAVDDTGIATLLAGAPALVGLQMERLAVTDATVANILIRSGWLDLDFDETQVSLAGVEDLVTLTSLRALDLRDMANAPITDTTVLDLTSAMPDLREFSVTSKLVTDAGLANIGSLLQMRRLTLSDTELSDTGVAGFTNLSNLIELSAERTQVTSAGKAALEAAIPGVAVYI